PFRKFWGLLSKQGLWIGVFQRTQKGTYTMMTSKCRKGINTFPPLFVNNKSFAFIGAAILVALLFFGGAVMQAQAPAGKHRPASVPEDYVITPFGYFHPSCIVNLSKGDTLDKGSRAVRHADGYYDSIPTCGHPRYNAKGKIDSNLNDLLPESSNVPSGISVPSPENPYNHAYVVQATTMGYSYGELVSSWIVPPPPASNDGQTIFFFPGLVDNNAANTPYYTILQPVLGWNSGSWFIASWNCCIYETNSDGSIQYDNTTNPPTPITNLILTKGPDYTVNPGDIISGMIKSACTAGSSSCDTWNVTTKDVTTGSTSTLSTTDYGHSERYDRAYSGAMEIYSIANCNEYPAGGITTFSTSLYNYDNFSSAIPDPGWKFDNNYSIGMSTNPPDPQFTNIPECNYGGNATAQQTTLTYGLPPAQPPTWTTPNIPLACNTGANVTPGPGNQGPLNCKQSATYTAPSYWKSGISPFSVSINYTGALCQMTSGTGNGSGQFQCSVALVCNGGTGGGTFETYTASSVSYNSQSLDPPNASFNTCSGVTNLNQVQVVYSVSNQQSGPNLVTVTLSPQGPIQYTIH
ncbi:MAG: hypothetical protein FWD64_02835, partial [Acidobacteriaceae bacterium]|nr:hypothetical protein [Acidobacteriaceae bacterium]